MSDIEWVYVAQWTEDSVAKRIEISREDNGWRWWFRNYSDVSEYEQDHSRVSLKTTKAFLRNHFFIPSDVRFTFQKTILNP